MPTELMGRIRSQFESSPPIVKLRLHQMELQRTGKFKEALELAKQIESTYNDVVYKYMKEAERQIEKVDVGKMNIPIEDKERVVSLGIVMFMCCDLIDFAVMDVDDILHKYDKELKFEMFDDIRQVSKMAKDKLRFLGENSEYLKEAVWSDRCDDMYKMIKSKARSIVNKMKTKS